MDDLEMMALQKQQAEAGLPSLLGMMYPAAANPFTIEGLQSATKKSSKEASAPESKSDFMYKQLLAMQTKGLEQQQQGIADYEAQLKKAQGAEINPWVAGAAGISDLLNGTKNIANLQQQHAMQQQNALLAQRNLQGAKSDLTQNQTGLIKAQLDFEKAKEKNATDEERMRMMMGIQKQKLDKGDKSDLFKEADKAFGKEYQDWNAQGGYASVEKQLGMLENAAAKLEADPTLSGGAATALPDVVRRRLYPEQMKIEQDVKQATQAALRQTLGSQFTEREGEAIMQRSYDPALPAADNIAKIRAAVQELKTKAMEKEAASQYALKHGTLEGYKSGNMSGQKPQGTDAKMRRLQELRAKKAGG